MGGDAQQRQEIQIFNAALELPSDAERADYLSRSCGADQTLKRKVEALLRLEEQADAFFAERARLEAIGIDAIDPLRTQPEPTVHSLGERIGRYRLRERIGEGGCGVVYVAEQEEPVRRRVALKVVKLGMDTREVIARFEAERQALAMMDHPNIAKVLDGGTTDSGRPYFVMELVRGIKITEYCDQHRLSPPQRLELFIKVCQAIQHAHQKGIIHRDIKPSNVLVTLHDGVPVPKVIDFGIAKAIEGRLTDRTIYTELQQFIGTPAYMSPEQAEMSGLDIDTRTDIYSLGVLLYELLTGKTPFDATELVAAGLDQMRRTIREREPARPSTRLSTMWQAGEGLAIARQRQSELPKLIHLLRGDLDWIVMKCLEKDRTRRYDTANGLASDVQRHLNSEPVVARPPSHLYRVCKLARRHKIALSAVAITTLALIAGLGLALIGLHKAQQERHLAVQAKLMAEQERRKAVENEHIAQVQKETARRMAYASDMNLGQQALVEGNLGRVSALLDRHRPAAGEPDLRAWEWRYLWGESRSEELSTLGIHPGSNAVTAIAFSLDGTKLASASLNGTVGIWDLDKRQLLTRLPGRQRPLVHDVHVAWLADSETVVVSDTKGVSCLDTATGEERRTFSGARDAAVSGDGAVAAIAFTNCVQIYDTASWKELGPALAGLTAPTSFSKDGKTFAALAHSGRVEVWDRAARRLIRSVPASYLSPFHSFALLSPDAGSLAIISTTNAVVLWDLQQATARALAGHEAAVYGAAFSPDSKLFATFSRDHTIKIWDVRSRANLSTLKGHARQVWAGAFSPDGRTLASAGIGGAIKLWHITPPKKATNTFSGWVPLGLSRNTRTMITLSDDGALKEVRLDNLQEIRRLPLNLSALGSAHTNSDHLGLAAASSDGRLLAMIDEKPRLVVFNTFTGEKVATVLGDAFFYNWDSIFSADDHLLATVLGDQVRLWHLPDGRPAGVLTNAVGPVAMSADGQRLVAGNDRGQLTVWDLPRRRPLGEIHSEPMLYFGAMFSPDGRYLGATRQDNEVLLWDILTGEASEIGTTRQDVGYVAFSPDGRNLAVVGESVKLYSLPARQEILTLPVPASDSANAWVRFSPDSDTLLAAFANNVDPLDSTSKLTCVWPAPSWKQIAAREQTLAGH